jgi:hypothetical protein
VKVIALAHDKQAASLAEGRKMARRPIEFKAKEKGHEQRHDIEDGEDADQSRPDLR